MGFIHGMIGNVSQIDIDEIKKEFASILIDGEEIHRVFRYIRDYFVFTSKRIVFVKKSDVIGKKITFHSVAYNKILHFSLETAGHFELKNKLKIWFAGWPEPIVWKFSRKIDIYELQVAISKYVL